jgi:molecular chaperone IbpA
MVDDKTHSRRIRPEFYDPFLIGFDTLFNKFQKSNDSYPPYNVVKASDTAYLLELAVAGFDEEDFDISLKDNVLTIKGDIGVSEMPTDYLHKGIATRPFVRTFTLADGIEVKSVSLKQGMLTIRLERSAPQEDEPVKFKVNAGA